MLLITSPELKEILTGLGSFLTHLWFGLLFYFSSRQLFLYLVTILVLQRQLLKPLGSLLLGFQLPRLGRVSWQVLVELAAGVRMQASQQRNNVRKTCTSLKSTKI